MFASLSGSLLKAKRCSFHDANDAVNGLVNPMATRAVQAIRSALRIADICRSVPSGSDYYMSACVGVDGATKRDITVCGLTQIATVAAGEAA